MRQSSLKTRLVISVLLCEALLAAGLLLVGRHYFRRQLTEALDSALHGRAISVAALVRYPEDNSSRLVFDKALLPRPLDPDYLDLYKVIGPDGAVLAQSAEFPTAIDVKPSGIWTVRLNELNYRGIRLLNLPILDEETGTPVSSTLTVFYATPTTELNERLTRIVAETGGAAIILLLLSTLIAAWAVQRSLQPLHELAHRASTVSTHNWTFEAPASARRLKELQPLIRSLEMMLKGLHSSFDQQRDFIDNAAHELKTPVAIQKSTLQLLLQQARSEAEYRQGAQRSLEDTERLEDLLQRLLRLAKADQWASGGLQRSFQTLPIAATCEAAIARMQTFADSRRVNIEFQLHRDANVLGDADDFEVIWSNLLENAIQYSPSGSIVTMRLDVQSQQLSVSVQDSGCGISPDQLPYIFDRFYRGDASRSRQTGGVGLGLAIVRSLVTGYGGDISVTSTPGSGSRFEVTFSCDGQ
jgi:signal transduction histidine kinase